MSKGTGCQHFTFGGDIRARMSTPSDWDGFLIPDVEALAQDFLELVGLYQNAPKGCKDMAAKPDNTRKMTALAQLVGNKYAL
jgi:hypothetical protein